MTGPKASFGIQAWSLWDRPGEKPELPELPAMLRRRASLADRMALRAALDCVPEGSVTTVFCSRHGELHRSVELMEMMGRGEGHLPMSFSLSVHNAASGLFGIARGDKSASTSLAAGADSLPMGVLEACALMGRIREKILLVSFDDAMPEALKEFKDDSDRPHALALLLEPATSFSLERMEGGGHPQGSADAIALGVANFLKAGERRFQAGDWLWQRNA